MNNYFKPLLLTTLFLNMLFADFAFCCLTESDLDHLDSKKVVEILSRIESADQKGRYKYLENCSVSIYDFAESILKSEYLTDVQRLDYYLRIQPLYPNNAEIGSVLGYDRIKIFMEYKRKPLKEILDSIKNPELKKRIRDALIDADMLEE